MGLFDQNKTIRSRVRHKGNSRHNLHKHASETLGTGNLRQAVVLPPSEDENEWLAVHCVDFFNQINVIFAHVADDCTPRTCKTMSAGPRFEFLWQDGKAYKKATRVSANQYVCLLMDWVVEQFEDGSKFPQDVNQQFPPDFRAQVRRIFSRFFRVFAHVYYSHFTKIVSIGAEAHMNSTFKHFYYFIDEYQLVDAREIAPLEELIVNLTKRDVDKFGGRRDNSKNRQNNAKLQRKLSQAQQQPQMQQYGSVGQQQHHERSETRLEHIPDASVENTYTPQISSAHTTYTPQATSPRSPVSPRPMSPTGSNQQPKRRAQPTPPTRKNSTTTTTTTTTHSFDAPPPVPQLPKAELPPCSVCTLQLDAQSISFEGLDYHKHCFKCFQCSRNLTVNDCVVVDAKPICQSCQQSSQQSTILSPRQEASDELLGLLQSHEVSPQRESHTDSLLFVFSTLPWYHGTISSREADVILAKEAVGTFLVRYSTNSKAPVISFVDKDGRVTHSVVQPAPRNAFKLQNGKQSFTSVGGLLAAHTRALRRALPSKEAERNTDYLAGAYDNAEIQQEVRYGVVPKPPLQRKNVGSSGSVVELHTPKDSPKSTVSSRKGNSKNAYATQSKLDVSKLRAKFGT